MDTFSIGINTKRKPKRKVRVKNKNTNALVFFYDTDRDFKAYEGPRWNIPDLPYITKSISAKFATLETCFSLRTITYVIEKRIKSMKFNFIPVSYSGLSSTTSTTEKWKAPQWLTSAITSYYAREENDWIKVRGIYCTLFNFKNKIKPLIFRWQVNKCMTNVKNTEDPVTLEVPRNVIRVIDFNNKSSFVYDSAALRKTIETRILYSDYMFPEPKDPINLLSNTPFSYSQLVSIINQFRSHKDSSWILEDLYKYNCDLELFAIYNKQRLKIEAINVYFKRPSYIIRETTLDFFGAEADQCELSEDTVQRFANLYDYKSESRMVLKWIRLTKEYYIAKELQDVMTIKRNDREVSDFMEEIYRFFL